MLSILVAYTKNKRVIGNRGQIPWNLPSERDRFKKICNNKIIIMGRKSFEEIGHALPYCTILIISKTLKKAPEGCLLSHSLQEGMKTAEKYFNQADASEDDAKEILIAGGGEIYKQALPLTDKIYATEIDANFPGDTFFPKLEGKWKRIEEAEKKEGNISYKYVTFIKK